MRKDWKGDGAACCCEVTSTVGLGHCAGVALRRPGAKSIVFANDLCLWSCGSLRTALAKPCFLRTDFVWRLLRCESVLVNSGLGLGFALAPLKSKKAAFVMVFGKIDNLRADWSRDSCQQ